MRTNTYFLSDLHLGTHSVSPAERLDRERRVVRWLDTVKDDASVIYLLGDILDYWYEYKHVVPRGFARFSGRSPSLPIAG